MGVIRTIDREMKKYFTGEKAVGLLRIVLAVIFIGASLYKIRTPADFAHQIFNYKILPAWAINPSANVLPWLQFVCGLALLTRKFSQAAGAWIVILMATFQIALATALFRGLNISCGCFKAGGSTATWLTFARDSSIFLSSLVVAWYLHRKESNEAG